MIGSNVFTLLTELLGDFGIVLIIIILLSNQEVFKQMLLKQEIKLKEKIILSLIFGGLGILATYTAVDYRGALANTREAAVIIGGLLGGFHVGIFSGLIAGIHRIILDPTGVTSIPCGIATIIGGIVAGYLYKISEPENRWKYGCMAGILIVSFNMLLVLMMSKPFDLALDIVKTIIFPMQIINTVGIVIILKITQNMYEEREINAAKQAELALGIADKTLPYFLNPSEKSFEEICEIIRQYVKSDEVILTDRSNIISTTGSFKKEEEKTLEILIREKFNNIVNDEIYYFDYLPDVCCKTLVSAPLMKKNEIIGLIILGYKKKEKLTYTETVLLQRLSKLISTQLELVKIEQLKRTASRSEIRALQSQINPHFLFNALNTIVSFVRTDSDKARDLIISLSDFFRYNLESSFNLITLKEEIGHVKSYFNLEQARFGSKIDIEYHIKGNQDILMPMLIIQPLIENSVKHGTKNKKRREVNIKITTEDIDSVNTKVTVEDDGIGINQDIIEKIKNNRMKEKHVGLINVHRRLLNIYGEGLTIERLEKGTRISFVINHNKNLAFIEAGERYELLNN
jgi:two-component system LytT family sensor kinase